VKRHAEKLNKKKIRLIGFISFLMGFAQAGVAYVMSSYFKIITGTENIGIFYVVAYTITLWSLLNFHKVVKIFGKSTVFYLALSFKIIAIVFLLLMPPSFLAIAFLMLYMIFANLEWVSMDIILESFSTDRMSGRIRGQHLTYINAGFLLAPFLSTHIVENYGFGGIFLILFVMNSMILAFAVIGFRHVNESFSRKIRTKEIIRKVLARPNIRRIYYISAALEFFYALMVMFTPIYLLDIGFGWNQIGIIFTVMLIPFVLLQYPAGIIADKWLGEKELIIFSLFAMAISTLGIYYMGSKSIAIWAIVLFATRIGAAVLEALRDSYFYKRIDSRDVDLIDFFRTAGPAGFILAAACSTVLLLFVSVKAVFALIAIFLLSALYPAFRLIDNECEKEMTRPK
jgi:MFS family permease